MLFCLLITHNKIPHPLCRMIQDSRLPHSLLLPSLFRKKNHSPAINKNKDIAMAQKLTVFNSVCMRCLKQG